MPAYNHFANIPWVQRLHQYRQMHQSSGPFTNANADLVIGWIGGQQKETAVRVVMNIGGAAFQAFLETGDYKNVYERQVVAGQVRKPSKTRIEVDTALNLLTSKDPPMSDYYSCALASGGTGVRFYGEYCLLLTDIAANTKVPKTCERNPYDLTREPLRSMSQTQPVASALTATWGQQTRAMLTIKVLRTLTDNDRLATAGTIAAGILTDEDYSEAHHKSKVKLDTVEEVREAPAETVVEDDIRTRFRIGEPVTAEEIVWATRRKRIRRLMSKVNLKRRVIVTAGRSARWG